MRGREPLGRRVLENIILQLLPRVKTRRSHFDGAYARSLVVFTKGANPTFSYYVAERLRRLKSEIPIKIHNIDDKDLSTIDPEGAFVIICRYLRHAQINWIKRHGARLAGVGLLIDDDVRNLVVRSDAGLLYRTRLIRFHLWALSRINSQLDIIWASTPALADTLADTGCFTTVLSPLPGIECTTRDEVRSAERPLVISFQATSIHSAEHLFLRPIVSDILSRYPEVVFEVSADSKNEKIWRDITLHQSRIRIRPTIGWTEFLETTRQESVDIALVPLVSNLTNRVRSDTKRIDVARLGAAAVFSDVEAYARRRVIGEVLVQNNVENWISAIEGLITSPQRRAVARQATMDAVAKMRNETASFPGILVAGG